MTFEYDDIVRLLPHAHPFILLDRVTAVIPGVSIVALKNISGTEAFIPGHFPRQAVFPGVFIIEAVAQAACVMMLAGDTTPRGPLWALARVDRFALLRPVRPGDQLIITVEAVKVISDAALVESHCTVAGATAARGKLAFGRLPANSAASQGPTP